jgi:Protein of unknown function (DUF1501)
MTGPSRRDLLRAIAIAGGSLGASGCARALRGRRADGGDEAPAGSAASTRRHHVVRITLDGGFDSVLTIDPKDPRTAGDVDVLYRADDRIRGARRLFGPLIGDLVRHDRELCIVHGVRHDTVAHDSGEGILRAGRKRYSGATPPFGDVVGEILPGSAPIRHLHLQTGNPEPFSESLDRVLLPGNPAGRELPMTGEVEVDAGTIARLYDPAAPALFASPAWLDDVQDAAHQAARDVLAGDPDALAAYTASLAQTRNLSRLLATAPRSAAPWSSALGPGLALALHAIRDNHARFITVRSPRAWLDTHTDDVALQRSRTVPILNDIAALITELKRVPAARGSLLDHTTVVIASELGRFPKLNMARGKDHWPETSWILLGRGVRAGITVGATDAQFRGAPIDFRTGRFDAGDRRAIDADALFATILRIAGGDPASHDYGRDSVLRCIVA